MSNEDDFDIDELLRSIEGLENNLGASEPSNQGKNYPAKQVYSKKTKEYTNHSKKAQIVVNYDGWKGKRHFKELKPALRYIEKNAQFIYSVTVLHPNNEGQISIPLKNFSYYVENNRSEFGLTAKKINSQRKPLISEKTRKGFRKGCLIYLVILMVLFILITLFGT